MSDKNQERLREWAERLVSALDDAVEQALVPVLAAIVEEIRGETRSRPAHEGSCGPDRADTIIGALGLHPDTPLQSILNFIEDVRSEARVSANLRLRVTFLEKKLENNVTPGCGVDREPKDR